MQHAHSLESLKPGEHCCCLYQTVQERDSLLAEILLSRLKRGERVLHLQHGRSAETVAERLRAEGLDPAPHLASGQLVLDNAEAVCLKDGRFDEDGMAEFIRASAAQAEADGCPGLCITHEMDWMLTAEPHIPPTAGHGALANRLLHHRNACCVCLYDRSRFGAAWLNRIIDTHPWVYLDGCMMANPAYVPADAARAQDAAEAQLQMRLASLRQAHADRREIDSAADQLALAVHAGRVGLWNWDIKANTIRYSPEWKQQIGYDEHEIGDSFDEWQSRVHPDDLESTLKTIHASMRSDNNQCETRFRFRHRNGSYIHILAQGTIYHDENGEPDHMIGSHIDVTRQQVDLAEAERTLDLLRRAERISGVGSWEIDLASGNATVSEQWAEVLGMNQTTISLEDVAPLIHPDDRDLVRKNFDDTLAGRSPYDMRYRFIRPEDGRVVLVHSQGRLLKDAAGAPSKIYGVARNITDEAMHEQYHGLAIDALAILNRDAPLRERIGGVLTKIRERSGCDAVGLRLQDGEDFPYYEQQGFSEEFLKQENSVVQRDAGKDVCRNPDGTPRLECACGLLLSGEAARAGELSTPGGSIWSNDAAALLKLTAEEAPRNTCIHEGYASNALVPVKARQQIVGLLQLNACKPNAFSQKGIEWLEEVAAHIGSALMRGQNEEDLRNSQQRLSIATRAAGMGIWDWDLTHNSTNWDNQMHRLFGLPEGTVTDGLKVWKERLHPEDREATINALETALREGEEHEAEFRILWPDGSERHIKAMGLVIRNENGEAVRMTGTVRDITKRKEAENRLEHLRKRSQALLNHSPTCYICLNMDLIPYYINHRGIDLLRLDEVQDYLNIPFPYSFFPEEYRQTLLAHITRSRDEQVRTEFEGETCDTEGNPLWLRHELIPVRGGVHTPPFIAVMITDLTEQRQTQERMRQMEKMDAIGQLAGGVAHDFNNQLAAIIGYGEMLANQLTEPKQKKYAGNLLTGAKRAAELTRQLLTFARKGEQRFSPVSIHDVIREAVDILSRSIDRRIQIWQQLNARDQTVSGNASQIQNAILNLGVNARDAMPEGGELTFETRNVTLTAEDCARLPYDHKPGLYLEVHVRDTGCGMPEDVKKRVFEPFFTTKTVGKGTGMGLATVYGTVKLHQGAIEVISQPGQGTSFVIQLPTSSGRASSGSMMACDPAALRGKRILIIDDEELLREMTYEALESLGCIPHTEPDGQAGVAYYREHWQEVDLVILDMIMPRMSGRDTFHAIREVNPNARVLVASGFSVGGEASELLEQGAIGFVQKPFQQFTLIESLLQAFEAPPEIE